MSARFRLARPDPPRPRPEATFCGFAGTADATNNVSERALRPSVIQRKATNGYRDKWAADAEAALRSAVDTACLAGTQTFHAILRALHS